MRLFARKSFSRRKSHPASLTLTSSNDTTSKASAVVSVRTAMPALPAPEDTMSSVASQPSRSRSPSPRRRRKNKSSYTRRPTLNQILADESPEPWTLQAFTDYAARNLCLENIEFIQDAERYRQQYQSAMGSKGTTSVSAPVTPVTSQRPNLSRTTSAAAEKLREMWTNIILQYIAPSSPKELNVPGDIRSGLLPHNKAASPVSPEFLQPAVKKVSELIEESILTPFLNEMQNLQDKSRHNSGESIGSDARRLEGEKSAPPFHGEMRLPRPDHATSLHSRIIAPKSAGLPPHTAGLFGRPSSHLYSKTAHSSTASVHRDNSANASLAPTLTDDTSGVLSPSSSNDVDSPPRTPPPHSSNAPKHNSWKAKFGWGKKTPTSGVAPPTPSATSRGPPP